ncbi:MAG: DUF4474 domain-containing protein [Clostridiales bacterium]|nr:DUF4474 domain-containing protein [Clostridiales bacterium]
MKKKNIIIGICAAVVVVAVIGCAVWLLVSASSDEDNGGGVEEITYQLPTTNLYTTEYSDENETVTEVVTEEATLSEEEQYIEQFLAEANTYTTTVETTTTAGSSVYFNVVTDGTVSDDNSLEGLTGAAKEVGEIILAAGFRYDKNQQIFYSESQSWQRNFGYSSLYDAGAALVGMYYDTMRLKFTYGGYDWMFQIWKGRYGITTGGEMGIYYRPEGSDGIGYACAEDEDEVTMSFALYKGDELYMTRGPEKHWWLTGFKLFDMIAPDELTMHATYFMDNSEMADALEQAIFDLGFIEGINYQRLGLTMTIIWN